MTALFNFLLVLFLSVNVLAKANCFEDTKTSFLKGEQLRQEGQYLLSLQQYALVTNFSCSENDKALATFASAQSLYHLGEERVAEQSLKDLFSSPAPAEIKIKGRLLQAWYEPETRHHLTPDEQKLFIDYEDKAADIQAKNRLKNPWISGVSSAVIPGLGQVYNGNYQSAALSFILNSLFLATTIELNRKNLRTSALASGLIFSITYTGNILGTVESSNTINRNYSEPLIEEQRHKSIPGLEL